MPLHDWRCGECGLQLDAEPSDEPPDVECSNCGARSWVASADRDPAA